MDDGSKGGARLLKQVKNPGEGLFMILLILQNAYCFWECEDWHFWYKNNYVAIGVMRVCYSLNVIQDGNNEVSRETLLIFLQLLYIVAKLHTYKSYSIFLL